MSSTEFPLDNFTDVHGNNSDEYFYDYDPCVTVDPEEAVPISFVYGTTLVLGILGNSLVILSVTRYRRMNNITNIFLLGLATADLLLVLICVPIKLASFLTFTWTFGEVLCKVVFYFQNVSSICSVTTLTTMSLERYYAILHPLRAKYKCTKGRARRAIIAIWLISLLLAGPVLHVRMLREVGQLGHTQFYWCRKQFDLPIYHQLFEVYMACILLFIPVTVMSFAYISICRELWVMTYRRSVMRSGGESPTKHKGKRVTAYDSPINEKYPVLKKKFVKYSSEDDKTRKQVIKMLVSIIVLFVVCWAPILINNVLVSFGVLHELNRGYLKPLRKAFYILAYGNSCVNPIVYGFMSKNFRETFKHALCGCARGWSINRKNRLNRPSSPQSRSTQMEPGLSRTEFELHVNTAQVKHELRDDTVYDSDGPIVEYL